MERSAGGDPDPLIAPWQPWPSQREDRKRQNAACRPTLPPPPPLSHHDPWMAATHPIITVTQSLQLQTAPSCTAMSAVPPSVLCVALVTASLCFSVYFTALTLLALYTLLGCLGLIFVSSQMIQNDSNSFEYYFIYFFLFEKRKRKSFHCGTNK